MNYSFFRKFEFGTEIKFRIPTEVNPDSSKKLKKIICEFIEKETDGFRFFEDEADFGEIYESDSYIFVVNSWHDKGLTLDVYATINITRVRTDILMDLLKKEFEGVDILKVIWKKGWTTEVSL